MCVYIYSHIHIYAYIWLLIHIWCTEVGSSANTVKHPPRMQRDAAAAVPGTGLEQRDGHGPLGHHLCPSFTSSSLLTGPQALSPLGHLRSLTPDTHSSVDSTCRPIHSLLKPTGIFGGSGSGNKLIWWSLFRCDFKRGWNPRALFPSSPLKLHNYSLQLALPDLMNLVDVGSAVTGLTMAH